MLLQTFIYSNQSAECTILHKRKQTTAQPLQTFSKTYNYFKSHLLDLDNHKIAAAVEENLCSKNATGVYPAGTT